MVLFRGLHHFPGAFDGVGNGLLREHMAARVQGLHGGLVMIGAVFIAAGTHADQVGLEGVQHFLRIQEIGNGVGFRRTLSPVEALIAHAHQLYQRLLFIDAAMSVANVAHADDTYSKHGFVSLGPRPKPRGPGAER